MPVSTNEVSWGGRKLISRCHLCHYWRLGAPVAVGPLRFLELAQAYRYWDPEMAARNLHHLAKGEHPGGYLTTEIEVMKHEYHEERQGGENFAKLSRAAFQTPMVEKR